MGKFAKSYPEVESRTSADSPLCHSFHFAIYHSPLRTPNAPRPSHPHQLFRMSDNANSSIPEATVRPDATPQQVLEAMRLCNRIHRALAVLPARNHPNFRRFDADFYEEVVSTSCFLLLVLSNQQFQYQLSELLKLVRNCPVTELAAAAVIALAGAQPVYDLHRLVEEHSRFHESAEANRFDLGPLTPMANLGTVWWWEMYATPPIAAIESKLLYFVFELNMFSHNYVQAPDVPRSNPNVPEEPRPSSKKGKGREKGKRFLK